MNVCEKVKEVLKSPLEKKVEKLDQHVNNLHSKYIDLRTTQYDLGNRYAAYDLAGISCISSDAYNMAQSALTNAECARIKIDGCASGVSQLAERVNKLSARKEEKVDSLDTRVEIESIKKEIWATQQKMEKFTNKLLEVLDLEIEFNDEYDIVDKES